MIQVPPVRRLWQLFEPIHAVTYFAPEPRAALADAGYRGFWMGYFAGRAAPLGPVAPEVVHALFYNFSLQHVARALPDAWNFAPPAAALAARSEGSVAALHRVLGSLADSHEVGTAARLTLQAAAGAPAEGRPLFAANRARPVPELPLARLWHATTMLREHRGDGHVAALLSEGVRGRESHVLRSLATGLPRDLYRAARHFDDDEWSACVETLRARGLVGADGQLSARGREVADSVESRTDASAWTAFAHLPADDLDTLIAALLPLAHAVVQSGVLPQQTPIGLDLGDSVRGSS